MENSAVLPQRAVQTHVRRNKNGTIKVGAINKSSVVLKILVGALLLLTVYAFWSFDYKEIQLGEAITATLHNMKTVFLEPQLSTDTMQNVLYQLLVTFCLGVLSTIFGAILAFFCALLCAKNLAPSALVTMGDDFEKTLYMAIIDAAMNKGVFAHQDLLLQWEQAQRRKLEQENAMFQKTKVDFHSMDAEAAQ